MKNIDVSKEGLEKFKPWMYDETKVPARAQPFLVVDESRVSSMGNLLVIAGPSKSGKSGVAGALASASINPKMSNKIDALGLTVIPNEDEAGIIYVSTEFSDYDFAQFIKTILIRAQLDKKPDNFTAVNFLGFGPDVLMDAVLDLIDEVGKTRKIRAVIIDGIGDFVSSINNEVECNQVVQEFFSVARHYQAVVVLIIHKNSGSADGRPRGHLGSQLERKCEGLLELTLKGDLVQIKGKQLRNAGQFNPRFCKYDTAKGYHVFHSLKFSPSSKLNFEIEAKTESIKKVFETDTALSYSSLLDRIMKIENVKKSAAQKRIARWVKEGQVAKSEDGGYTLNH